MSGTPRTPWRHRRLAIDALIGFTVFLSVVAFTGAYSPLDDRRLAGDLVAYSTDAGELTRGSAELTGPAATMAQRALPVPVTRARIATGRMEPPSGTLLAAVVSLLVVFDLAFFRHLRRAYASSRRSGWRRG